MAIETTSYVWNHSPSKGNARLMLLAIADISNAHGDAFPGTTRLEKKCNISESQAKRVIHQLETSGELEVYPNCGTKTVSGWTNLYRVIMPDVKAPKVRDPRTGQVAEPRTPRPIHDRPFPKEGSLVTPHEGSLVTPHEGSLVTPKLSGELSGEQESSAPISADATPQNSPMGESPEIPPSKESSDSQKPALVGTEQNPPIPRPPLNAVEQAEEHLATVVTAEFDKTRPFDCIAWTCFQIKDVSGLRVKETDTDKQKKDKKSESARIARVSNWLIRRYPDTEQAEVAAKIIDFKQKWQKDYSIPRDLSKFQTEWIAWEQAKLPDPMAKHQVSKSVSPEPEKTLTPEEVIQRKADLAALRQRMAEE